ncbi:MAG TPA: VanZ family protein [Bacteroidota bacterium]|nr:VanZ family protein [Bacteroidota bacterium]
MSPSVRRFLYYQFPAILWAVVIFGASSIPEVQLPSIVRHFNDKFLHAVTFFVFGILIYRAIYPSHSTREFRWKFILLAILVVVIYGISDEFHQSFVPGRTPDVNDAAADSLGGLLAAVTIFLLSLRKKPVR